MHEHRSVVFDWCYNVNDDLAKELTSASFPKLRLVRLKDCFNMPQDLKKWVTDVKEKYEGKSGVACTEVAT